MHDESARKEQLSSPVHFPLALIVRFMDVFDPFTTQLCVCTLCLMVGWAPRSEEISLSPAGLPRVDLDPRPQLHLEDRGPSADTRTVRKLTLTLTSEC